MNKNPAPDDKDKPTDSPAAEALRPQDDGAPAASTGSKLPRLNLHLRHANYRPSHKATFIGISAVVAILAINAGVIAFFLRGQATSGSSAAKSGVVISSDVLDKLGVSRNPIASAGTSLVVSPNARFNGTLTVGSDVSIAGQLNLNGKLSASDTSLSRLVAGDTTINQLNVTGNATVLNLNLNKDLTVLGLTKLQGAVTIAELLTVNNSVNVSGNLAVGGLLSARSFEAGSLTSDTTLTIGGHVITRGLATSVRPGGSLGSNGTVSISGNDAAGTVAVNIGVGGGGGILAYVTFVNPYSNIPHVVVTAIGAGAGSVYVNRNGNGFNIGVNGPIGPGSYAFDYIVMQ